MLRVSRIQDVDNSVTTQTLSYWQLVALERRIMAKVYINNLDLLATPFWQQTSDTAQLH